MFKLLRDIITFPFTVLKCIKIILTSLKLLSFCIIPWIIGIVIFSSLILLVSFNLTDVANYIYQTESWWIQSFIKIVIIVVDIFLAGIISLLAMNVLGGFFLEEMIFYVAKEKKLVKDEQSLNFATLARIMRDEILKFSVLIFFSIMTLLLGFFPPLALLSFLICSLILGFQALDLPLAVCSLTFKQRLKIFKKYMLQTLMIGIFYTLLMLIPLLGILLLPAFYLAVVDKIEEWKII